MKTPRIDRIIQGLLLYLVGVAVLFLVIAPFYATPWWAWALVAWPTAGMAVLIVYDEVRRRRGH